MDYKNPNSPNTAYANRPSRAPLFITLVVLAALAIVAIVAITPRNNTPLVTGDQVAPAAGDATTTAPMVDGGPIGDGDVQPMTEADPSPQAQSNDLTPTDEPLPDTNGAGGTAVAP